MTTRPIQSERETLAEGLQQAGEALEALGGLAADLGEQTTLAARYTLTVKSVAEVDGIAADMDVKPGWSAPWTYQATWTEGTVTVAVAFTTDPFTAPASLALIEGVCGMAAGEIHGNVA